MVFKLIGSMIDKYIMDEPKNDRFKYPDYDPQIVEQYEKKIIVNGKYSWTQVESSNNLVEDKERENYNFGSVYNNFDNWLCKSFFNKEELTEEDIEAIHLELQMVAELFECVKANPRIFRLKIAKAIAAHKKNIIYYQKNPTEFLDELIHTQKNIELLEIAKTEFNILTIKV